MSERDEKSTPSPESEPPALWAFLDSNQRPLSVLGVLVALVVLSKGTDIPLLGNLLAFCFLSMAALVWLEIWLKLPAPVSDQGRHATPWRVNWFANFGLAAGALLVIYVWLSQEKLASAILAITGTGGVVGLLAKHRPRMGALVASFYWGRQGGPRSETERQLVEGAGRYVTLLVVIQASLTTTFFVYDRLEAARVAALEWLDEEGEREGKRRPPAALAAPVGGEPTK